MHQFARSRPISELWPPPTAPINTVSGFSRLGVIKGRCLSKHVRSTATAAVGHWIVRSLMMGLWVCSAGGCNLIGFAAHVVTGGDSGKTVTVAAEYRGLEHRTVAVLVSADEYTFFEYPDASEAVCRQASAGLAANVPGIELVDPLQISRFQQENPFWNTLRFTELLKRLQVDRIIYVDLVQYALHEPGNVHLWRGSMVTNVAVAASDAPNADNFVYKKTLQIRFPEADSIGLLNANQQTIRLGMLRDFSRELVDLFRDHEVVQR